MRDVAGEFGIAFDERVDFLDARVRAVAALETERLGEFVVDRHAADGHADFAEHALPHEHFLDALKKLLHAVADRAPDENHVHLFAQRGLADFLDGDVRRQQHALVAEHFELALNEFQPRVVHRVERGEEKFHFLSQV